MTIPAPINTGESMMAGTGGSVVVVVVGGGGPTSENVVLDSAAVRRCRSAVESPKVLKP